jgi:hypothetical protein
MSFSKLVNTRYFQEAALDFEKNKGYYTKAPRGSREYVQYWEMQDERCKNGYSVGDLWIPGRYYFFLNFTPMLRIAPEQMKLIRGSNTLADYGTLKKMLGFPGFREVHFEWTNLKYIAWHGGEFMGIKEPRGGKHIGCLKARRAGWSYIEASDGVYNFNFIKASKSLYFAGLEDYLTKDGILNKVEADLNWINTHIPWWKQNRQVRKSVMHQRASFINSMQEEEGSMAEILGVIVNDPDKVRGKNGLKITYEEGGSFRNLKKAYDISRGTVEDSGGLITTGQISVFGTGGEEGPDIEGMDYLFNNPEENNMIALPYIWEPGMDQETCGYFVPVTRINMLCEDDDGNIDVERATAMELGERAKIKDPDSLDQRKAEYPLNPSEALMRTGDIKFPIELINRQLRRLKSDRVLRSMIRHGKMIEEGGILDFFPLTEAEAQPVLKFPHKRTGDRLDGCVTVVERPYRDARGHTPEGMYQIVFDPYYMDDAEDQTSLFAIRVWKMDNKHDSSFCRLPVAWYTGRKFRLADIHKILFQLARWYNCTVQGEAAGGGQGVIDYARANNLLHYVEFEPEMAHNKELSSNGRNRSYLMAMPVERKLQGLTYLIEWCKEIRGRAPDGSAIYNIDRYFDVPGLLEMKKFNAKKGNFDRISADIIGMYMLKERPYTYIKEGEERDEQEEEMAYPDQYQDDEGVTTAY